MCVFLVFNLNELAFNFMIYTSSDITFIIVFVTFVDPMHCMLILSIKLYTYIVHNILYASHYHC